MNCHTHGPDWAVDTWAAVGAEVAAALRISLGKASSVMHDAQAMDRLPAIAELFRTGSIDMMTYRTLVYRTALITDDGLIAEVDRQLAARAARWPSMTQGKLAAEIDRVVAKHDRDAVRRTRERARDRDVTIWDDSHGLSDMSARLFTADARLLDQRLEALGATVCPHDPRTPSQRRSDALAAMAAGAERLRCRCEQPDCTAATATASPVVIHVVAEQTTLEGRDNAPGYLLGSNVLIPAELLRELAQRARLRPLLPTDRPAEPRYRPSAGLADFVRARDLTCRAPGCDCPATECDIDHTVPYAEGGCMHASNTKCLCRFHHILKTFWGWRDRQLQDGTVIWDLPDGQTYVTTPGSALLFPALMQPTGPLPSPNRSHDTSAGTHANARMPRRQTSRAQNRANYIAGQRAQNQRSRERRDADIASLLGENSPPVDPDDEPPF